MSDIKFVYVLLKTLLTIVFLVSGYFLGKSRSKRSYWSIAIIPITAFGIISGLRFGREIDYNVYYLIYMDPIESSDMELLFACILKTFTFFSIPYSIFVMSCSVLLICSFLFLLYKFRIAALWILPLLLGIMGLENLIRWYLSFSFILVGFRFLLDKKYMLSIFFALASLGTHSGMILCLAIIFLFYLTGSKIVLKPYLALVLFALSLFMGSTHQLVSIASYVNYLPMMGGEKAMNYLEKATDIASGSMKTGIYDRSFINNVRLFLCYGFPIYFIHKTFLKTLEARKLLWLHNLAIFSIVLMPLFNLIELFNRVSSSLMVFSIIYVGLVFYYGYKYRSQNKLAYACLTVSFLLLLYPILKVPFDLERDTEMLFIWDAGDRNYLPY